MQEPLKSVVRLLSAKAQTLRLLDLQVCSTCLLRIGGETSPQSIRDADSLIRTFVTSNADFKSSEVDDKDVQDGNQEPVCCPCCFGLLQDQFRSEEFLQSVLQHVKSSGYIMNTFWCSLTLPNSAEMRMRSFDEFWNSETAGDRAMKVPSRLSVKDAWKAIVTPVLTSGFSAKWVGHEGLEINIEIEHPDMENECDVLKKRFKDLFQDKRGPDGTVKRTITRHSLEKLFQTMTSNEFRTLIPFPPKPLLQRPKLTKISCIPGSLFLGGRYLKFSRNISQSPWFIEEAREGEASTERKGEASVEEIICKKVKDKFKGESWRFLASGREDIDVRCLGDGRPFAVELMGAKIAVISESNMIALENEINSSTNDIEVRYLEAITKSGLAVIKTGEEQKTKTYSAICEIPGGAVTKADVELLNSYKELVLVQKTPIRVLHRRANAERKKIIHEIRASLTDRSDQFRLDLKTQAGTYVKEFVHGDFGRTEPSVSSLLNKEVECEELDVTGIDLKWPPSHVL